MKLVSLFSLSFCLVTTQLAAAPPVNDNKASATVISGNSVVVQDDCAEATFEPGDFAQKTQWWQWTAPASGRVTFDTVGSAAPHLALQVRLKESSGAVTGLVAHDPGALYNVEYRPSVSFPVVAGTTYLIGTGTVNASTTTQFRLELILDTSSVIHSMAFSHPATMANDLFSGRVTLAGNYAAGMAYNASATTEAGEPVDSGLRTFWWTYTPSSNGRLSLSTVNGDAIGKNLVIYMGSEVNTLKVLESKTTGFGSGDISITLPVTADTTYQISLGSYQNVTTTGALVLSLALDTSSDVSGLSIPDAATLANDMFAARVSLSGSEVSAIGHGRPASNEAGEPAQLGTRTLWWKYRPSANGRLTVTTDGSSSSRKNVGVYLGESLALLRQAAFAGNGYPDANPTITLPVTADTEYPSPQIYNWAAPGPDGVREPYYNFIEDRYNGSTGNCVPYQVQAAGKGVNLIRTILFNQPDIGIQPYPAGQCPGTVTLHHYTQRSYRENVHWYLTAPLAQKLLEIVASIRRQGLDDR